MKYTGLFLLLHSIPLFMQAQAPTTNLTGEYYLQGVMETASGFKLNADSTFEFFFSYGALDRFGKGTWTVRDKKIVFNSRPKPLMDFALRTHKKVTAANTTIKMVEVNENVASYVECTVKSGNTVLTEQVQKNGEISFPLESVDSIMLQFRFCPEKTSVFINEDKKDNYFEFAFEPWMLEYFFQNFSLALDKEQLTGNHPLLTGTNYSYIRN